MSRSRRHRKSVMAGTPVMIDDDEQLARAAEAFFAGVLERERASGSAASDLPARGSAASDFAASDFAASGSAARGSAADDAERSTIPERNPSHRAEDANDIRERREASRRVPVRPGGSVRDAAPAAPPVILDREAWQDVVQREAARWQRHGGSVAILAVRLARRRAERPSLAPDAGDPSTAADPPTTSDPLAAERYAVPLGDVLRHRARASDPVARVASDQFSVLLLEADEAGASAYAERIRAICEPWVTAVPGDLALRIGWSVPGLGGSIQLAADDALARVGASSP